MAIDKKTKQKLELRLRIALLKDKSHIKKLSEND